MESKEEKKEEEKSEEQQKTQKIPVICVLHRQVLLVITGTHAAMNIASTQQLQ
jgi:hypothetical protein